jgi:HNH endonuclease
MAAGEKLTRLVRERARRRCEYCQLPDAFSSIAFEVDHIIAEQHGGRTMLGNLAWACFADNHHKGPNLGGIDPKTGRKAWLFHPRRHKWDRHFHWSGAVLIGRTAIGRATIVALQMNAPHRVAQRAALILEGVFFES